MSADFCGQKFRQRQAKCMESKSRLTISKVDHFFKLQVRGLYKNFKGWSHFCLRKWLILTNLGQDLSQKVVFS